MKRSTATPANPEAYLAALEGWQRDRVLALRDAVKAAATLEERIKWGHLVYFANGPVCLIRAEAQRVLFGFWRGQRLREIEPRLKPGGKYEMATLQLKESDAFAFRTLVRLVEEGVALNSRIGDPTASVAEAEQARARR